MKIVISSGKGGTGKTFLSTNLSFILSESDKTVNYIDCDVEEPNGHLFLKPQHLESEDVTLLSPVSIDDQKCTYCGQCSKACRYNAIAVLKDKALLFTEMCHVCGVCEIVCPEGAIFKDQRKIGVLKQGVRGKVGVFYALLETAEGGMTPRLIQKVKEKAKAEINILDSPPGTSCPVVETVKDADICVLVTDPTPFGVYDLKLAVKMCREIGQEPVVVVNRATYYNDGLHKYCQEENVNIIAEIPDDRRVAEVYSVGDLVVEKLPEYRTVFEKITQQILQEVQNKRHVGKTHKEVSDSTLSFKMKTRGTEADPAIEKKEIIVLSGKGGTGKTSLSACFAALAENHVVADCDVDAADLHLILKPKIQEEGLFSGGSIAKIEQNQCLGCGVCELTCQFNAIEEVGDQDRARYKINALNCEGCGACSLVCPNNAVVMQEAINGKWYISDTDYCLMSHAELGVAEENSGKLVSLVRQHATFLLQQKKGQHVIIDGAPGTGCPVIASVTGAHYAVVVTEPTVSGLHDLTRVIQVIKHFGVAAGVVINKCDLNVEMTEKIKKTCIEKSLDFLGIIPYDETVTEAQVQGLPVVLYKDSLASKSINEIWNNIKEK